MLSRSWRRRTWVGLASASLITVLVVPAGIAAATAGAATAPVSGPTLSRASVPTFTPALTNYGTVNFSTLAGPARRGQSKATGSFKEVDNHAAEYQPRGKSTLHVATNSTVASSNVKGQKGFTGINGYQQAVANGNLDLEPPDQGLCADGNTVGEFINNAFTVYDLNGDQALPVLPSYALFKQPSTDFFSDPRCYFDAATQRWFLIEFIVGTPDGSSPSIQFIDVSNTSDPTGTYTVWGFDTTDANHANCPCFGDYDILGADGNGFYVATDEFGVTSGFNGAVVYAVSKTLLENFANTGIAPVVFGYRLGSNSFGPTYVVSPTTTPQGAQFAPNTEYFVESNSNANSDNHLYVYALNDTSTLAGIPPSPPNVYDVEISSNSYSFPPDANQKPGPIPTGKSVQDPEGMLEADFNAVMQTTYVGGNILAELDTGTSSYDAAAWYIIKPKLSGSTLTAKVTHQGYVKLKSAHLIYPAIGVNKSGNGYMTFTLSGPNNYPSSAYVNFGSTGASGPVHIAFNGTGPEDGFTCYAAFVGPSYGGCRWGDYSSAVASGNRIYMATETVPGTMRDYLSNWGTYVFSAPAATR